jgi:hypothetical protein
MDFGWILTGLLMIIVAVYLSFQIPDSSGLVYPSAILVGLGSITLGIKK